MKITFNRIYRQFIYIRNFFIYFFNSRRPFWITEKSLVISDQLSCANFFFAKQNGPTLDHILAISDQYAILICFGNFVTKCSHFRSIRNFHFSEICSTKWPPAAIADDRKSLLIAFLAISDQYGTFIFLGIFFTKCPPAAILDDRKSLLIAFLAISDQYATFNFLNFFPQNGRRGHFGRQKITYNRISGHFRSICNYNFSEKNHQNGRWRPFWLTENNFRSHFLPFQINTQHFGCPFLPKSIGTSLYSRSVATSNMKLVGAFLIKLWSAQAFSSYFRPFWFYRWSPKSIGFFHSKSSITMSNMNFIRALMSQLRETQALDQISFLVNFFT